MRLWCHDNQELAVAQAQVSELSSENARFHTRVLDFVREREQQALRLSRRSEYHGGARMPPRPQPRNWPGLRISSANRRSPLTSVPAATLTSRPVATLISFAGSEPNNELTADILTETA